MQTLDMVCIKCFELGFFSPLVIIHTSISATMYYGSNAALDLTPSNLRSSPVIPSNL